MSVARLYGSMVAFGAHVALRLALTLHADVAARRARSALLEALPTTSSAEAEQVEVMQRDSLALAEARLDGFRKVQLAPLLLSLAEAVTADVNGLSASVRDLVDEALERWVRLLLDVLQSTTDAKLRQELCLQLGRAQFASGGLKKYGRLHLLLAVAVRERRSDDVTDRQERDLLLLLAAALHQPRSSAEGERALADLRLAAHVGLDPMRALVDVLQEWPGRKVVAVVVQVLPAIFDSCTIMTPAGTVSGAHFDCHAPPLIMKSEVLWSPLLKSVYCACCVAASLATSQRMERYLLLRRIVDVARAAVTALQGEAEAAADASSLNALADVLGAFVYGLLDGKLPDAVGKPVSADGMAAMVSVSLLLRSIRQSTAAVEGSKQQHVRSVACEQWLQQVEGLALLA